jgi:hypothetical protein
MPAPFAMPPTTKPVPRATAVFGFVSVVMIASAAASPASGESFRTALRTPSTSGVIGSGTPITPVDITSTSSVRRQRSRAASAAVATASATPCSPVAAFATPELTTIACGWARSRCARETVTGAAWTRLEVNMAAPTAGTVVRISARSRPLRRMPALTAAATKPFGAVTLIRAPRAV